MFQACINKKGLCLCYILHTPADQLIPQLLMEQFDTLLTRCRNIEQIHERVWLKNIYIDKMTAMRT